MRVSCLAFIADSSARTRSPRPPHNRSRRQSVISMKCAGAQTTRMPRRRRCGAAGGPHYWSLLYLFRRYYMNENIFVGHKVNFPFLNEWGIGAALVFGVTLLQRDRLFPRTEVQFKKSSQHIKIEKPSHTLLYQCRKHFTSRTFN